jgi:hypothetical protein
MNHSEKPLEQEFQEYTELLALAEELESVTYSYTDAFAYSVGFSVTPAIA